MSPLWNPPGKRVGRREFFQRPGARGRWLESGRGLPQSKTRERGDGCRTLVKSLSPFSSCGDKGVDRQR